MQELKSLESPADNFYFVYKIEEFENRNIFE